MAALLLLCIIVPGISAAAPENPTNSCLDCIKVNQTCYNLTHVLELKGEFRNEIVVAQMGILRSNRMLYYSFEPKIEDPEYYKIGFVDLTDPSKHGELAPPTNVQLNFGCFDFDQGSNVMYLGGSDGVYKLDTLSKSLSHFSSRGDRILSLVFKDNVYFVRDREHEIILKIANTFVSVLEDDENKTKEQALPKISVKKFVITKDNTVVFLSKRGLFASKVEKNSTIHMLSKNSFFRGLSVDLDGTVYTWWIDGIYKVVLDKNLAKSKVVRVAKISSIGALTFDDDNSMLFTADKSLFRLVKTDIVEC